MPSGFAYDVFLSHNSRDKPRVRKLAERLKSAGLRVWFDDWIIKPGDDIYLAIEHGLEAARVQVLCLSPEALGSEWVTLERSTVLFRDPGNKDRRFVPLLLADCDLPDTLRRYKHLDFRRESQAALDELLAACQPEAELPPVSRREQQRALARAPEKAEPLAVLERKLTGHQLVVWGVAVSPDGTWAVSGADDNTVKIWNLGTGECRATLKGHKGQVLSVAITPDGRVLSAGLDETVRVWDSGSARKSAKLQGHGSTVYSVVALRDNIRALSGGFDRTLRLWELRSGECLTTIRCGTARADDVFGLAVSCAGTQALSGHRDGTVRLWSLETGERLATLKGHSNGVNSVRITPDGRFAVSGSSDRTAKIWDLETKTCAGTLEGHQGPVYSVAVSPNGALIASPGEGDRTVRLWDWKSGACLQVIAIEDSPISVAFGPDGSRLVVGTGHGSIFVYGLGVVRAAT
jgi:WD40 repeat protein